MIVNDQFTNLPPGLIIAFSSRHDGTMLDRSAATHDTAILSNRKQFCATNTIDYTDCVFQRIIYDERATYNLIAEVDTRSTTKYAPEIVADGLMTKQKGVGMLLPVADCIATVLYDPLTAQLALLHLGRHSTLTDLLSRTIRRFVSEGSDVQDICAWMAPSVQWSSYRMEYFDRLDDPLWKPHIDNRDGGIYLNMQGYNQAQCIEAGILRENITISSIDTAMDASYFSHSQGDTAGRIAVLAMMR